jgi:hypothetical protein
MVELVVPPRVPPVPVVVPGKPSLPAQGLGSSPAVTASIDAYLGAGDGMARVMSITMVVGLALIVLVAVGWALGMLPGAVKLF